MSIIAPLKPGDKVAVVATAKRLEQPVEKGIETLEKWGLTVRQGKSLHRQHGYFAGSDEERLFDIQYALDDPQIKAIIFARGGYGTTRILDQIDFSGFRKHPKWLVGFSDLTSILLQSLTFGIPAVHGPVCITLGKDPKSDQYLRQVLFGTSIFDYALSENSLSKPGSCSGEIVGGNLSLIFESIGASNEIETKGNILFIEEVGEDKYSVDRMMNKLKRTGKLNGLTGVIIGSFSHVSDSKNYFSEPVEQIVCDYFKTFDIPIAVGLEAGHEQKNYPLILGMNSTMSVTREGEVTLRYYA